MAKLSVSRSSVRKFVDVLVDDKSILTLKESEVLEFIGELQSVLGVSENTTRHSVGTFVLHMPIQYMQENAKPKDVTVYNLLKDQLTKINNGETAAIILPALTDENGNRMFTLEYVGPLKV